MTSDYLISWLTTVGYGRKFKILVLRDGDELMGVCPLVDGSSEGSHQRGIATMGFAGEGLWGYADFICREDKKKAIVSRFMDELLSGKHTDVLHLGPFIAGSSTARILEEYLISNNISYTIVTSEGAPFIETAPGIENFKKSLAGRTTVTLDVGRRMRRLAELGTISMCRVQDQASRHELKEHLTTFLDFYMKQWPENRFKLNPAFTDLYLEFGYRASQKGFLDFSFLRLNEKPIAYHFGFIHNKCLYWFTPTYDVDFKSYSPGKVLLWKLIENCFENSLEFDFLNAMEPYKLQWTKSFHERLFLRIASSAKGRLHFRIRRAASTLRSIAKPFIPRAVRGWYRNRCF
jgi:hypothetical protein